MGSRTTNLILREHMGDIDRMIAGQTEVLNRLIDVLAADREADERRLRVDERTLAMLNHIAERVRMIEDSVRGED